VVCWPGRRAYFCAPYPRVPALHAWNVQLDVGAGPSCSRGARPICTLRRIHRNWIFGCPPPPSHTPPVAAHAVTSQPDPECFAISMLQTNQQGTPAPDNCCFTAVTPSKGAARAWPAPAQAATALLPTEEQDPPPPVSCYITVPIRGAGSTPMNVNMYEGMNSWMGKSPPSVLQPYTTVRDIHFLEDSTTALSCRHRPQPRHCIICCFLMLHRPPPMLA